MFLESDASTTCGRLTSEFDVALFIQENATKQQQKKFKYLNKRGLWALPNLAPHILKAKQGSFSFTCGATEICVFEESPWIFKFPLEWQWECGDWKNPTTMGGSEGVVWGGHAN